MNIKLIVGSIISLLLISATNSHAQCVRGPGGYMVNVNGGSGYICPGGYSRGCYQGGYGYGCNGNNWANCTPWGNGNGATLNGIASIVGAIAPVLQQALVNQQQQQPQVIYIQK